MNKTHAGHAPKRCTYDKQTGRCSVSFEREHCIDCPYKAQCKPKIYKRIARLSASKTSRECALTKRSMSEDEFKNYARLRNGIETVPSNLRRNYRLEKLPRGKQRGKFFLGAKIAALNFRKLLNYLGGRGNYAQNPIIAQAIA